MKYDYWAMEEIAVTERPPAREKMSPWNDDDGDCDCTHDCDRTQNRWIRGIVPFTSE